MVKMNFRLWRQGGDGVSCCLGNGGSVNKGRHGHRGGKCRVKNHDNLTGSGNVGGEGETGGSGWKVSITQAEVRRVGDRSV